MKRRWPLYFLSGLIFGAGYWHYLSLTAGFFNVMNFNVSAAIGEDLRAVGEGLLLILALLAYFGVCVCV